ncbi:MAG: hypothetical protein A2358_02390 [Candidatus Staskawiczbacteria bacterium RIFOXYB1_FULL_37_44]|uniref:Uncharacterized protein n=1 Tax=Candidatus Staskawiczbacteria bacterium RIFOXYB1_FULL_37_44 TaxID=1802223 RepID=A0A1G2ITS9_9BACT|nr:MAG: hypothetical protein A2358_02390 [Candidatus Staskawiczbacteria bacterium RIFOXYB1_FULL_37_44]OGZ82836.1 MAG: hypothetical protein A2416_03370 [Candidatus Staskawiczbacteria bacterium RIFOXYC1_FULL_37_52]OGZ87429.1 MAG: hypothetical protein A2444_00980 [Candidatus Staskawiczbacteria bacterium RIFOXYC2_FULL_37_19]OGZ89123.1 MAG: hypothetical protein A2581_01250 [Candidatus Staskawiczbacteria bacterium RIFOXYD1_FULL_37_110]
MTDTYYIKKLNCAHCGKENNLVNKKEMFYEIGLPYQFGFGNDFVCKFCKQRNEVEMEFKAVKPSNKKSVKK